MSKATQALKKIFNRIEKAATQAVSTKEMRVLGEFSIALIVKRTLLGYGVNREFGSKKLLKPLSRNYVAFRSTYRRLSGKTQPRKSNLTLTGKMLDSMAIRRVTQANVIIGPTGDRLAIAGYQEDQGRVFNRLSQLEYNQVLRFYRKTFADLLKKQKLLR